MDPLQFTDSQKTVGIDLPQPFKLNVKPLVDFELRNAGRAFGKIGPSVTSSILWPLRDDPEGE